MYGKKIILGILLHVVVRMEKISKTMDESAITCDEIIVIR